MQLETSVEPVVNFVITRHRGQVTDVWTNSPLVNHFLDRVKMNRAYNTWISYVYDLKAFFDVIRKPPETITRADCIAFMEQQDQAGCSERLHPFSD